MARNALLFFYSSISEWNCEYRLRLWSTYNSETSKRGERQGRGTRKGASTTIAPSSSSFKSWRAWNKSLETQTFGHPSSCICGSSSNNWLSLRLVLTSVPRYFGEHASIRSRMRRGHQQRWQIWMASHSLPERRSLCNSLQPQNIVFQGRLNPRTNHHYGQRLSLLKLTGSK